MAIKISSLIVSKQILKWVAFISSCSSISCATHIPNSSETDQNSLHNPEFEAKIRFLKNKLNTENLIQVLDSTKDLNSSIKIFKWASHQKRFYHTADTYFWVIFKLGMVGNLKDMEFFCNEMIKEKCPHVEEAFASLIDSFSNNHRLDEAVRVLEIMNLGKIKPSIRLFNVLLRTLMVEKRDLQSILFAYKEIVKSGIVPNVETLNYLIEILCESDKMESALDQYRRMNKKGCCPNSRTFEILICSLCKQNRIDESLMVLREMFELGCNLDLKFYNTVIPLLCKASKPEEGMRLYRMMRELDLQLDLLAYGDLVRCLCENLLLDDAIRILEEMLGSGLTPMVDVYADIVSGLCKLSKFNDVTNFLEDNVVSEISPHNALLEGYCNAGKFHEASGYLEKMVERNVADTSSWSILIRGLCKEEKIRKAFEILTRMLVSSYIPDLFIYSALIFGYCKESKYEDALELFRQACSRDWVLDSSDYAELIDCLCRFERIQEAAEVLYYMSSKGCSISSSSFNLLIKGMCLTEKLDEAISLYCLAYHFGISINPNTILLRLYESRRTKDVLVLFSRMVMEGCLFDEETYSVLMDTMCVEKRTRDCAQLLDQMVGYSIVPSSETLDRVLSFMACHFQLHIVTRTLTKLASKRETYSLAMYNMLIHGLMKEGHKQDACKLLDHMLDSGWVPDAVTHSLLIGSVDGEETHGITEAVKRSLVQDKVSSILIEGFEET
ncbi:Pentatricopeptide repeat-containing protein [Thalictrum thalictroides]|uniref:Pentatricopeptide repeat-containing protein n=1 Tax=Thalictrum thalictroides TaxID=46969 RepID=A0A7J6WF82_THATH|nr:Pentatricopeptide repeat-containing protein [Thalictrum thalictroides]